MNSPSLTPDDLRAIVEETVRRVMARVEAPAAPPASASASPGAAPGACTYIHGMAALPAPPPASAPSPAASPESAPPRANPTALVAAGACRLGNCPERPAPADSAPPATCSAVAPYLDHTLLKPAATDAEVRQLCEEARRYGFAAVCVNSAFVPLCASLLAGTGVTVCSVVGFPLGAMSTDAKAYETRRAVADGAREIDMVIPVGKLQAGDYAYVLRDIEAVVGAAHGVPVKVILETALLTQEQKIIACALAKAAGAAFVKTSTGFVSGGATVEDIALMRRIVGAEMGVKASGGVRDCATAMQMIEAGATRIGASASVAIVTGAQGKGY